jgi:nickel-dependent lactate racemase
VEREIELPYGTTTLKFHVPDANLAGVYLPQPVNACTDPAAEVVRALTHPLELNELRVGEVQDEDVTILITHGTHRLSSDEEVRRKVGEDVYADYADDGRLRIVQHQCTDEQNQVYLGLTSRSTPVWVNRLVVEADRCVGIGHIGPSPYAGYSGGSKLIVPGVASLDTINANHSLVAADRPGVCRDARQGVP